MFRRNKSDLKQEYTPRPQEFNSSNQALPLPRLWIILLVLALPLFVVCANFFEALERAGTIGAFIADTMLPATMIGYLVLVFILKNRRI